jgi:hypothetical protein
MVECPAKKRPEVEGIDMVECPAKKRSEVEGMDMVEERTMKERPEVDDMDMVQECPTEGRDIDELNLNGSL